MVIIGVDGLPFLPRCIWEQLVNLGEQMMPVYQFVCQNLECKNEFEKIVPGKHEIYKWCKYCDRLTTWIRIEEKHHFRYHEQVCSSCLGNDYLLPMQTDPGPPPETVVEVLCPICGGKATRTLRIVQRGSGIDRNRSSVTFRFNYLAPDAE